MKNLLSILLLFVTLSVVSQSKFYQYLDPVKEGKTISQNAWLIGINEDTITYSDQFRGKWLLIDYWSLGCRPCIASFPYVKEFTSSKPDNLEVIYVNLDRTADRWKKGNKKYELANTYFGGLSNTNHFRSLNFSIIEDQLMTSFPQYVLLDPTGKIVSKALPKPSSTAFKDTILKLISE